MWSTPLPDRSSRPPTSPYIFCASNPVNFSDHTGKEVFSNDEESQKNIIDTLSDAEKKYINFINGKLDHDLLLKCNSESINFTALTCLSASDLSYIFALSTTYIQNKEPKSFADNLSDGTVGITLTPVNTDSPSPYNNVYILTSSLLPKEDQVTNVAHEGYGHAYFYELKRVNNDNLNPYHDYIYRAIEEFNFDTRQFEITILRIDMNIRLRAGWLIFVKSRADSL